MTDRFVSTQWLAEHLEDADLIVLDASWYLPGEQRDPHAQYREGHIPGAVFFDIDAIADRTTDLPHMLPAPADFARMVGALGISDTATIIVYDEIGLRSAPRVWWALTTMGAKSVKILAGGGPKWRAEGRPLEAGDATRPTAQFDTDFNPDHVANFDDVRAVMNDPDTQIIDARPADRFNGEVVEPRKGVRSGHIPGSINVPVSGLSKDGELLDATALADLFKNSDVDLNKPIITTCGSGITASTLALALEIAGAKDVAVYDGSWTEWGGRSDAEIA